MSAHGSVRSEPMPNASVFCVCLCDGTIQQAASVNSSTQQEVYWIRMALTRFPETLEYIAGGSDICGGKSNAWHVTVLGEGVSFWTNALNCRGSEFSLSAGLGLVFTDAGRGGSVPTACVAIAADGARDAQWTV